MVELWTPEAAAQADRFSLEALGVLRPVLMERAALALANRAEAMLRMHGHCEERGEGRNPVVVLCGPGNNGGDGVALARILKLRGYTVRVFLVCGRRGQSVTEQSEAAERFGVAIDEGLPPAGLAGALFVDALLGTGSGGEPRGAVADALAWLDGRAPVLAVDLPTGLDARTGALSERHVRADATVTFERSKPGLHLTPGLHSRGALQVAQIGLVGPFDDAQVEAFCKLIDPAWVGEILATRKPAAHKAARGQVVVLGGSAGTEGAAILSGAAALAGGAGLCTLVSASASLGEKQLSLRPELMRTSWDDPSWRDRASAIVIGPGLTDPDGLAQVAPLWESLRVPSVWDASALGLSLGAQTSSAAAKVLTPHPKEAAGLLSRLSESSWTVARVQSDRVAAARCLAARSGAVVVLKGAGTVVCQGEQVWINSSGDERLATAGSGDVLAGLIGALLAQGHTALEAAVAGVHLHGVAGESLPSIGARAMDIADALPKFLAGVHFGASWPEFVRG